MSEVSATLPTVRPALKAGLRPVWRDRETVQIGIDPRRAVALTGMGDAAAVIGLLDGSRDRDQVIVSARERGVPAPVTERILNLLAAAGVLDDFPVAALAALSQDQRHRLRAELASAALARGYSDAGAAVLARRDAARVQIYGPGRIAGTLTDILTTSGVGNVTTCDDVHLPDCETDRETDREAGGSGPAGGWRRDGGWRQDGRPLLPDLAILIGYHQPELAGWLMRARVAHLALAAEEAIGIVGPLVRPGRTSCLHCLHLTRSDLDPAWPLILAQLMGSPASPAACDAALAASVAAQAATQALTFLDRYPAPAPAENGTLELELPHWQWRRRTWPRHPACPCLRPR
jgi:bacteriocin biosynthesis cyclodehydratase domain-containing protein